MVDSARQKTKNYICFSCGVVFESYYPSNYCDKHKIERMFGKQDEILIEDAVLNSLMPGTKIGDLVVNQIQQPYISFEVENDEDYPYRIFEITKQKRDGRIILKDSGKRFK